MTPTTDADDWLEAALAAAARARVAVFGDFCLDAYWTIDPDERERSLETDLPVRRVRTQRYAPGGAGNIASNLAALGVREVRAVGLVGADAFGRLLRDRLAEAGVDAAGLLDLQPDWQTMVYAKPVVAGVEGRRIDFGAFNVLAPAAADALADRLAAAADEADAVVVNQQVPAGVATLGMIDRVNALAADRTHAVFVADSRHRAGRFRGCCLKLNAREAAEALGAPPPADHVRDLARRLFERTRRAVFVTRGARGIVLADAEGARDVPGVDVPGPVDPVGAGDTVAAAVAAVLGGPGCGADALSAARLANLAAAVTVAKVGVTGTATPDEVRRAAATARS